jgi:nucleolar protein TMA23
MKGERKMKFRPCKYYQVSILCSSSSKVLLLGRTIERIPHNYLPSRESPRNADIPISEFFPLQLSSPLFHPFSMQRFIRKFTMDARAYLKNQGWRGDGHSLDTNNRGLSKPLLISKKVDALGVGINKHAAVSDQWWMRAFDESLKDLGTGKKSVLQIVRDNGVYAGGLYGRFVPGEKVPGTFQEKKRKREDDDNDEGKKKMMMKNDGDSIPLVKKIRRVQSREEGLKKDEEGKNNKEDKKKKNDVVTKIRKVYIGEKDEVQSREEGLKKDEEGKNNKEDKKKKNDVVTKIRKVYIGEKDEETKGKEKEKKNETDTTYQTLCKQKVEKDVNGFMQEAAQRRLLKLTKAIPRVESPVSKYGEPAVMQVFVKAGLMEDEPISYTSLSPKPPKQHKYIRTKMERTLKRVAKEFIMTQLSPEEREEIEKTDEYLAQMVKEKKMIRANEKAEKNKLVKEEARLKNRERKERKMANKLARLEGLPEEERVREKLERVENLKNMATLRDAVKRMNSPEVKEGMKDGDQVTRPPLKSPTVVDNQILEPDGSVRYTWKEGVDVPYDPAIWADVKVKLLPKPIRRVRKEYLRMTRKERGRVQMELLSQKRNAGILTGTQVEKLEKIQRRERREEKKQIRQERKVAKAERREEKKD